MASDNGKIKIGLFGFGRTGSMVVREMTDAPNSELVRFIRA